MTERSQRRQSGAALLVTMMVMLALALMGVTTLNSVRGDQQIAGFQARSRVAFHAAEAGLAAATAALWLRPPRLSHTVALWFGGSGEGAVSCWLL